jgi:hypothetical protein
VPDAQHGAAQNLAAQRLGVNHRADIGDSEKVGDLVGAGFDIDLDFGE